MEGIIFSDWKKEQEFLAKERIAQPHLFEQKPLVDDEQTLRDIGIEDIFGKRPLGHLKLYPEDFIVEEIGIDGATRTITPDLVPQNQNMGTAENNPILWADVVKVGADTAEVAEELARRLKIDKRQVGFAGRKDWHAITAQVMSFQKVRIQDLAAIDGENFFLKNIDKKNQVIHIGDLVGNRFTLVIRITEKLSASEIEEKLKDLNDEGFWNFYYLQRFGAPRHICHKLGLLILQKRFEEAIQGFLAFTGEREFPYFRNFREQSLKHWRNWSKLLEEISVLPYSFRYEKKMFQYLLRRPDDFIGALRQIPEEVKLWVQAYNSYLFNETLSTYISSGGDIPFTLPLATDGSSRAAEIYDPLFHRHDIAPPFSALAHFPFIMKPRKDIETLKKFKLYETKVTDEALIIDFSLDKGSYATTFLSHIFTLSSGEPVPQGISLAEVDSKKLLGTGTCSEVKQRLPHAFEILRRGKTRSY